MCVPTRGRPEIEAGCIYFTDDRLGDTTFRRRNELCLQVHRSGDDDESDVRYVGVYSLKDGTVKKMEALGEEYNRCRFLSPPVWIMPSIP